MKTGQIEKKGKMADIGTMVHRNKDWQPVRRLLNIIYMYLSLLTVKGSLLE